MLPIAQTTPKDTVTGKVIYPITQRGGLFLLLDQFLYASMLVAGVVIAEIIPRAG